MENFNFKKKFGQNFLQNKEVIKKIVNVASIKDNSLVIEVGPGSGNLTMILAKTYTTSNILAYEVDISLEEILDDRLKEFNNVDVLFCDFLKTDLKQDIDKYNYDHLYFVSNVPYYITTPILFKLIDSGLSFEKIVMMVQKEVGDRFTCSLGRKEYGALTVILNYYFDVKKEFIVDRNQFYPRPNVDSVVVSLTKKKDKLLLHNEKKFLDLVHDSFKFKRKMIRNNLKNYNFDIIEKVLNKYGFDLTVRAEQLDYNIFVDIANSLF